MANKQSDLKKGYVTYFMDVPVQRYAAMYIGRDEDTIIRWRKDDPAFADAIQRAKAEWIRKRVLATKAEFALERLEKEIFSPSTTLQIDTSPQLEPQDPNTPENKRLVDQFTEFMMEKTKRVVSSNEVS